MPENRDIAGDEGGCKPAPVGQEGASFCGISTVEDAPEDADVAGQDAVALCAADIRTFLLFHQQMGIVEYPLTAALRQLLATEKSLTPSLEKTTRKASASPSQKRIPVQMAPEKEVEDGQLLVDQNLSACSRCSLAATRQGYAPGAGKTGAGLMVVGDFSCSRGESASTIFGGVAEDALLWSMMKAIGLGPEKVYVTNVIKCCLPHGQQPDAESERQCVLYLQREIEIIRPKVLCAMGEAAARAVTGSSETVLRLRGKWYEYQRNDKQLSRIQVFVTFHPRFLLAYPDMKRAAWQDLQMVQRRLQIKGGSVS